MRYEAPSIRGNGLKVWIDKKAKDHPLNWGYKEWLWLYMTGLNNSALARAMNVRAPRTMVEWIKVHKEEQGVLNDHKSRS